MRLQSRNCLSKNQIKLFFIFDSVSFVVTASNTSYQPRATNSWFTQSLNPASGGYIFSSTMTFLDSSDIKLLPLAWHLQEMGLIVRIKILFFRSNTHTLKVS